MDTDVFGRDQAPKVAAKVSEAGGKLRGSLQDSITHVAANGRTAADSIAKKAKNIKFSSKARSTSPTAAAASQGSRPLALMYVATAVAGLLFIGSCGPVLSPKSFGDSGVAGGLKNWSPLPQAALLLLLLGMLGVVMSLRKKTTKSAVPIAPPAAGVIVHADGTMRDAKGAALPRGLRMSACGKNILVGEAGAPLPKGVVLGPGGVLIHAASGRPIPHSCGVGANGELLSSTGEALPDSMSVGPNSTLLAADGTVLSPDLQPVPAGFHLSSCGKFLMRPNGRPVPRGVHVGPGFRLLTPTGEHLPDGVKIGPNGTIICLDGSILASDGAPLPAGYSWNLKKQVIIDPEGNEVEASYSMGPNCTLIDDDGNLLTVLGRNKLCEHFELGPLGNLLMRGEPVPAAAAFTADGQLVLPSGEVLNANHEH